MTVVKLDDLPIALQAKVTGLINPNGDTPVEDRYSILGKILILLSSLSKADAQWVTREALKFMYDRTNIRVRKQPQASKEDLSVEHEK